MVQRKRRESDLKRSYFRHPLAAVGASLVVAGFALFFVLVLIDLGSGDENPYQSLFTFIGAPFIIGTGFVLFLISVWWQIRSAHKAGEDVAFDFSIVPYDPQKRWNLWLFMGLSFVFASLAIYSGYRGYEATESTVFCSETCHDVMSPQGATYLKSPHAKVSCAECHIGPGASFWVKAKVDGIRQVFAAATKSYSRPIETPIHNLRPAQETCEQCHWPEKFYGEKMVTNTYYAADEENSPWTIKMLVKIGGGNPRTGKLEGIHWHMLGHKVEYISTDEKREDIPWIRMTEPDGKTTVYTDPGVEMPDTMVVGQEIRVFDCMDCHNRPSHLFLPPAKALNLSLSTRRISPELPEIRRLGIELLIAEYETKPEALQKIEEGLRGFYNEDYPDRVKALKPLIDQAVSNVQTIYEENFFPAMKTDYRARQNHLTHFVNNGCFRCHDGTKESKDGRVISKDCNSCHTIVAQGPFEDVDSLVSNISGLRFKHPEDIDEAWTELLCTECHTPESGY